MKVLFLHNRYQQSGGEDVAVQAEKDLLESHGHSVTLLEAENSSINGFWSSAGAAASGVYSLTWKKRIHAQMAAARPDVVHVHNFFPLISPAVHWAAREAGVPLVQTLHNYRLLCPNAIFFRDGRVCEDCLGKFFPWPAVTHACYRDNWQATGAVASMLAFHKTARTWTQNVDAYIALSNFARRKFIQGGLPSEKIFVKPNFTSRPLADFENAKSSSADNGAAPGEFALFAGRLVPEKGPHTLIAAWRQLSVAIPIRIYGDGPLLADLQAQCSQLSLRGISFAGRVSRHELLCAMKKARFLVFPSEWYECFPMTLVEAFACGVPVVASRLGAAQEIVEEGSTGLFFNPGDSNDLARKVEWAWTHPREMTEMGKAARKEYELKYTPEVNLRLLLQVYERAMQAQGRESAAQSLPETLSNHLLLD